MTDESIHGFDHSLADEPCIRDDSTECECARCVAAEDDFWRTQEGEDHDDVRAELDAGSERDFDPDEDRTP